MGYINNLLISIDMVASMSEGHKNTLLKKFKKLRRSIKNKFKEDEILAEVKKSRKD